MASIRMRSICKTFDKTEVIRNIDLSVDDNEFVVFVGPSGCGKSTLLRILSGLENQTSGEIEIDGQRVEHLAPAKRGIAMVFQSYALYPHMSVYQNMSYALRVAKVSKSEIDSKVREAAGVLQLTSLLDRKPKELSGGQRQRVAIGRAIVRKPKVFLFDEPLSNLDAKLRVQMRLELTKLHRKLEATMIYVTHDQVEAMTMADKIVVMRDGLVEQIGAPLELYNNPVNQFVAGFIGSPSMNFMVATIDQIQQHQLSVSIPGIGVTLHPCEYPNGHVVGDDVTVGVRPEHLAINSASGTTIAASVIACERLGGESYVYLTTDTGVALVVHSAGDEPVTIGDQVMVGFLQEHCHLFDAAGIAIY